MNYIKTFLLVGLTASLAFLVSCSDDDAAGNGQPKLLSFGPVGVKHGETIKFIGENLNKVTAIVLAPAVEISASNFASQSPELIELVIPNAAESGKVILKTSDSDIESKTVLSFEVPVEITGISGSAKPGTNITIIGNFVNWIESVTFSEGAVVNEFVSKSLTEVVVTVPMEAKTGSLIIITGGTEPMILETTGDFVVTLPAVTGLTPDPIERGGELTITGTDLDLVQQVKLKGNVTINESDFISKSETKIVLVFPEEANKGTVSLVAYSGVEVESAQALIVVGDLPPLAPLGLVIYRDGVENGWQKWGGWGGGSSDLNNSDNVREGEKGIKIDFGGDWGGAMQLGGGNSSTTGFSEFTVSIFGTPGTGGKVVNLIVKGGTTEEKQITIVEGEWTEYKLPLGSTFGNPATVTELFFQDRGWSGTLYVDAIGLR